MAVEAANGGKIGWRRRAPGLALAFSLAAACGLMPPEERGQATPPSRRSFRPPGYVLSWSDEFSGSALDTTRWTALRGDPRATPR